MANSNFRFKVNGDDKLYTIDELIARQGRFNNRSVKVIDMEANRSLIADFKTIRRKFG